MCVSAADGRWDEGGNIQQHGEGHLYRLDTAHLLDLLVPVAYQPVDVHDDLRLGLDPPVRPAATYSTGLKNRSALRLDELTTSTISTTQAAPRPRADVG